MQLQVLSRHPSRPWLWSINHLELAAEQPELIKAWVQHTQQQLRALSYRSQRLLVFVNPYGGKRQARRTWAKHAQPILTAAGVKYDLVETQYQVRAAFTSHSQHDSRHAQRLQAVVHNHVCALHRQRAQQYQLGWASSTVRLQHSVM